MNLERTLSNLDESLSGTRNIIEKINLVSKILKDTVGADKCTIFIYDEHTNSFWSAFIEGVSFIELSHPKGLVSKVFSEKKASIFNNVAERNEYFEGIDRLSGFHTKSMLAAPMINFENKVLGVIQLINKLDDSGFTQNDLEILNALVSHLAKYAQVWIAKKN